MSKLPQSDSRELMVQDHPLDDLKSLLGQVLLASACLILGCLRSSVGTIEAAQKTGPVKAEAETQQRSTLR